MSFCDFSGHETSKLAVSRAKENVHQYRRCSFMPCAPQPEDPPPPYSVCPPFNPSFGLTPSCNSYHSGPSTSYDVPDGGNHAVQRNASHPNLSRHSNVAVSGPSNQRVQPSTSTSANSRPRRRGFFFRTSFRRSETSGSRASQRNEDIRPRSMPGPSRSTNPFDENDRFVHKFSSNET